MDRLKAEDERLNVELEDSHEDFDKMKTVFEKRIDLYKRFLKDDDLTDRSDRLALEKQKRMDDDSPPKSNDREGVT